MTAYVPPAIQTALSARGMSRARTLIWLSGKDFTTGAIHTAGFWNHDDVRDFVIGGVTRTYAGAGTMLEAPTLTWTAGLKDNRPTLRLPNVNADVATAIRGYDARMSPIDIYTVLLDPVSDQMVGVPMRRFQGTVDIVQDITPAIGGDTAVFELKLAGNIRRLTRTLSLKHSAEDILRVKVGGTPDQFGKYADISGKVVARWG